MPWKNSAQGGSIGLPPAPARYTRGTYPHHPIQQGRDFEMDHKRTKAPDACDADVGRRIRAQRLLCHMSQTELGNRVGITFQQIQKYEKGVNRVGAGRLARIADVLSVPVSFFFSGDPKPSYT